MLDFKSKFGRFAKKQLQKEYFLWLTTVDSTGTPQPRPVWFIREGDTLLVYSQAKAYRLKHIRANPNVAIHFNSTDTKGESGVVIFSGKAKIDRKAEPAHKTPAYLKKYKRGIKGLKATPEGFADEYSVAIRITLTNLRGWG